MISENHNQNEENSNVKVSYTDFSQLTNFNTNNEINSAINNIRMFLKDINSDWLCQFESINDLRRLNKFQPKLFLEIFHEISLEFVKLIISIRSNIAKLALILLKEFFSNEIYFTKFKAENNNYNNEYLNNSVFKSYSNNNRLSEISINSFNSDKMGSSRLSEISNISGNNNPYNNQNNDCDFSSSINIINSIFDTVIPYVLQQSCTMKAFLKEEANQCLENIGKFTQSIHFLKKINLQINNKNATYAENAFLTANNLLENMLSFNSNFYDHHNPSNKSLQCLKEVMEINLGLFNLKKDIYAKKAIKLMNKIKQKIGNEIFDLIKSNFDNYSKLAIDNMINEANKATKTTGNLKEFIKSKK